MTFGRTCCRYSISLSFVSRPKLKRNDPRDNFGDRASAVRTFDGSGLTVFHADPELAASFNKSKCIINSLPSIPSNAKLALFGNRQVR